MKVFLPNDKNYVELGETGDLLYVQAIANGTMISYNEVPLLTNPRPIAWRIRHVGDTVCLGWQLSSSGSFEDSTCLSHPAWRPEASYAELAYWSRQALASDGYAYFDAVNP